MKLSKRLHAISEMIAPYKTIIDIGSDHALLPIYLLKNNKIDFAIATDLRESPITQMKEQLVSQALSNLEVIQSDGFKHITKQVDVAIIAGMGGYLIKSIITQGKPYIDKCKRIIIQANLDVPMVREQMNQLGFQIVNEVIIEDKRKIYEVISFQPGRQVLDQKDIIFGPILRKEKHEIFIKKWEKELNIISKNIQQLPEYDTDLKSQYLEKLNMIKEVLY